MLPFRFVGRNLLAAVLIVLALILFAAALPGHHRAFRGPAPSYQQR